MKLTQQDMARLLEIDARTLRNWRKNKPFLYKTLMQGFKVQEVVKQAKENYESLSDLLEVDGGRQGK
jgi:hypothetical protein